LPAIEPLAEPGLVTATADGADTDLVLYRRIIAVGLPVDFDHAVGRGATASAHLPPGQCHLMVEEWNNNEEAGASSLTLDLTPGALPVSSPGRITDHLLGLEAWFPGLDVNGDGQIDAADIVTNVDHGTRGPRR
jgi:hypothetical protein